MVPRYLTRSALFALSCALFSSAQGAVVYDESVAGDLSNSGLSPTVVHVGLGSNRISGTTGFGAAGIDRDYFSITVPSGAALSSLTVLPGTSVGGDVTFIGVQVGPQVTVATDASTAAGLLGWMHYGQGNVNRDILPRIGTGDGATGFTGPLGAGTYSFWVQDFNSATYDYDLTLTATAVPEPEMYVALAVGLVFLIAGLRHVMHGNLARVVRPRARVLRTTTNKLTLDALAGHADRIREEPDTFPGSRQVADFNSTGAN